MEKREKSALLDRLERVEAHLWLAEALTAQKKYGEAETPLLAGYEEIKQCGPKERLIETLEQLVHLYDSWGKNAQAVEWRSKLAKAKDEKDIKDQKDEKNWP